MKITNQGKYFI